MLPAIVQPEYRSPCGLHLIGRALAQRAACGTFFVGEMDGKAVRVLVAHPRLGKRLVGPVTKSRDVPGEHVVLSLAFDHPLRGHQAHAARLRETGNDPARAEIIAQFGHRAKQNIAVGRPDHRAVDHPLDACLPHGRNAVDGAHHVLFDPFEVIGEQLMPESRRCAVLGPEAEVFFIGPNQKALPLLPHVIFTVPIRDRWQAPVQRGNLAPPQPGRIDHPLRVDRALGRLDDPASVGLRDGRRGRGKAMDLGPARPRARRIGMGHARRVHVAAIGFIHDRSDAVEIHQRVQIARFVTGDFIEIHAIELGLGRLQPELMFTRLGLRQIERAGLKHATALPGLGLQLFVEVHGIVLDAADISVVMQPVDIRRRVPCGARGQLVPLQQDNIAPSQLRQVIENRAADHAAPDHNSLSMGLHFRSSKHLRLPACGAFRRAGCRFPT